MNLSINGQQIQVQGIRALRPGITVEQATQKTKNNGLDEVYFNSNGHTYIAYGDSLNISALKKNNIPTVLFNNQKADVVAYEDEANSIWEGAAKGAIEEVKNGMNAVRTAVSNLITTVQPAVAVAGGVGITGLGIYQIWRASQAAGTVGAGLAASSAAGSVGWIGEALRGSVVGGLKVAAISGGVGLAILGGYGAIRGALETSNASKDYGTIASVTEEGTAPVNGGEALSWAQLYPPGGNKTNSSVSGTPTDMAPIPGYGSPNYGVPSYGSPIFFQQPVYSPTAMPQQPAKPSAGTVSGLMSPQQLAGSAR